MSAYFLYVGKGKATIPGVPARDLTFEEALLHGPGDLLRSGLYERAIPEPRQEPPEIQIVEETEQDESIEEKPRRSRRRKENDQ